MSKTLALIHTGSMHPPVFTKMCQEIMPNVNVFNIVDESLLNCTIAANELTPLTARRLAGYIQSAEEAGADVIMVTCSSLGPAVEAARPFTHVPLLRVDEAMVDKAVSLGRRIGVIATLSTTLAPTTALVQARAKAQGREIEIVEHLCSGAFEAVLSGDTASHDRLVIAGLRQLLSKVDVIVLAQASMARATEAHVVDTLTDDEQTIPILSSPQLGLAAAKAVLEEIGR